MRSIRHRAAAVVCTVGLLSLLSPGAIAQTAAPEPTPRGGTATSTPPADPCEEEPVDPEAPEDPACESEPEPDPTDTANPPDPEPEPDPTDTANPPDPEPEPDPTDNQPEPEPEPEPEPQPEPEPSPTPTPTVEPPEPPSPDPGPDPGTRSPEPTPDATTDEDAQRDADAEAEAAYEAALQDAFSRAVAEASRLLVLAEKALTEADERVAAAEAAAEEAEVASAAARRDAAVARAVQERTESEMAATQGRIVEARNTVGEVARRAYQGTSVSTLGVMLEAETPSELTDRVVGVRALLRAGDSALGDLGVDEANLRNAEARFAAQVEVESERVADADDLLSRAESSREAAERAREGREERAEEYQRAVELMDEARAEDEALYEEFLGESLRIGTTIRESEDLGDGVGTGDLIRPGSGQVTSEFGPRFHPILRYNKLHTGIDFGAGDGRIVAADSGTVVTAEFNNAYGNMVVIDHGTIDGRRVSTLYAHQAGLSVDVGQRVEKGQYIGQIGSTGYSTGPHLHLEVRVDGEPVEPRNWLGSV